MDSKTIVDLYTDWCINYVAEHYKPNQDAFMKKYFRSIRNVVNILNKHLYKDIKGSFKNAYGLEPVPYNKVVNIVYLKGGSVADHYGGTDIKPSDIDCSVVITQPDMYPDADKLNLITLEINKELDWFAELLPGINDHEDFYNLLDVVAPGENIQIYNAYNVLIRRVISSPSSFITGGNKLLYSETKIYNDIDLIRFKWIRTITDGINSIKLKINIVDLSIHLFDKVNGYLLPCLERVNIMGESIWVETIHAALNNQLNVYVAGIVRNDKKLSKRRDRVLNILKKIDNFEYISNVNTKDGNIRDIVEKNIYKYLISLLRLGDAYPYLSIYILLYAKDKVFNTKNTFNINVKDLTIPQTAVVEKTYEYYDHEQKLENIMYNINKRITKNSNILNQIQNNIMCKSVFKKTNIYPKLITNGVGGTVDEETVLKFIKNFDNNLTANDLTTKKLSKHDITRFLNLQKLNINTIRLILDDDDYNIYNKLLVT